MTLPVDTTEFADGRHTVEVWVLDAADNASLQSYDVEFANAVPTPVPTTSARRSAGSPTPAPTPFVVRRPPIAKPAAPAPRAAEDRRPRAAPKRVSSKGVYTRLGALPRDRGQGLRAPAHAQGRRQDARDRPRHVQARAAAHGSR